MNTFMIFTTYLQIFGLIAGIVLTGLALARKRQNTTQKNDCKEKKSDEK